jgi:hypothetical protein
MMYKEMIKIAMENGYNEALTDVVGVLTAKLSYDGFTKETISGDYTIEIYEAIREAAAKKGIEMQEVPK